MLNPGAALDATAVREFIHAIAAQAKAALGGREAPGFLQLSRLHPADETLVPSRYQIHDVDRMVSAAMIDCNAGHNVYIEGRLVRRGLNGNGRGKLADTEAVFALVIDSDADKGMGWTPTGRVSMTVETSPGNFQYWFFLKDAVSAETGKRLGERIRAATTSDHDTGVITQCYRVAGTINYPSAAKIKRGRSIVPTGLAVLDPQALWTPEMIEAEFPLIERKTNGGDQAGATGATDETGIPDETMRVIRDGVGIETDRSRVFWNVMIALKRSGWTVDGIVALLEKYPNGIAQKYLGRLRQEVERIYGKLKDAAPEAGVQRTTGPTVGMEALKAMTFAPMKYVVPSVLVEGLTLFAGKPKIGKSWLLLHAGIAVASGGFTLGDLHCKQGDVLYCALEDNLRRLQSRGDKLLGRTVSWPSRLEFICELPRLAEGGLDTIREWIKSKPHPRLILIDTLGMVRTPKKLDQSSYDADYGCMLELRQLASESGIAIVLVHHLRKADSDDAFDTVSGTLGLTGAADTILILKRDSSGTIVLHGRGRDLIEIEKAMTFDANTCMWRIAGDAAAVRRSHERNAILEAIADAKEPIGPNDIAVATGMRAGNVRRLLGKLVKEGAIEKVTRGCYRCANVTASTP